MSRLLRPTTGLLALLGALALPLVLAPAPARAQQTGTLVIETVDESGQPVSDVAITLEGEKLQGFRLRETDTQGRAHFPFLTPGQYVAEFVADGYVTFRSAFVVGLGAALVERVTLTEGSMEEQVTVSAQAPIDITETGITDTYDTEELQKMQIGSGNRSYQSVLQQSAGVGGGSNPNVHGATLGENRYLVDGVDTTDPLTGTWGTTLNYESIEQVEFRTGGFQAEHGQATGGLVNVITKSGGNEFQGSFDGRYFDEDFIADSSHFDTDAPQDNKILELWMGGPIVKDKLWWSLGASTTKTSRLPSEAFGTRDFEQDAYFGKLTWQPHPDHRVAVQYNEDPAEITNQNASRTVAPEAHYHQSQGAEFLKGTYWGSITPWWTFEAQAAYYKSILDSFPENDTGVPSLINDATGFLSENYVDAQFSTRRRNQLGWKAAYTTRGKRWHEIKFGMDIQQMSFAFRREQPGGAEIHVEVDDPDNPFGTGGTPTSVEVLVPAPETEDDGRITSFFVQDTWHPTPRITVDYGLRFDHVSMDRDDKSEVASWGKLQPRIGGSFDLTGEKRHVVSFHVARTMDPGLLTITNSVNSNADLFLVYEEPMSEDPLEDCPLLDRSDTFTADGVELPLCTAFGGPGGSFIADDIDAMYVDEVTAAYKWAIRPNLVFGARWIWRETNDIIEDAFSFADGAYVIDNIPELRRTYQGVELDVAWETKRFHVSGSWTIAGAKGHVDYTQSLGVAWDVAGMHTRNRYGYLPHDQRHRIKVQGWVDLPRQWTIGWDAFWGSGLPYERVDPVWGHFDLVGSIRRNFYGSEFVDPRGSHRLPSRKNLDLSVTKTFDVGRAKISLVASVENVTKENSVTSRNETEPRLPLDAAGNVIDFSDPDLPDPPPEVVGLQVNPDSAWGDDLDFQDPRTWELGLKVSW